jgi:hypothetical protein
METFQQQLPTKDILFRHEIITSDLLLWPGGCVDSVLLNYLKIKREK